MKLTPLTRPALWNYCKYELVAWLVVTGAWPGAQRHGVWPQNYRNQRSRAVSMYPPPLLYLRYPCITINPPYQFSPPRLGPDLEPELDIGPARRTQIETNHLCGDCLKRASHWAQWRSSTLYLVLILIHTLFRPRSHKAEYEH